MKLHLFWKKIKKTDTCWLWTASCKGNNGYGAFKVDHKLEHAHRVMYRLVFGEIPKGLQVLHRCDNPKCVNPDHLFIGTIRNNMDDMVKKGRHLKVKVDRRLEIPSMLVSGKTQTEIATILGCHQSLISKIMRGKARLN